MGDMAEDFRVLREAGRERRAENRRKSLALLEERKIPYTRRNLGAHLIVCDRFDFWPGTGLWIERETKRRGRGVRRLIALLSRNL